MNATRQRWHGAALVLMAAAACLGHTGCLRPDEVTIENARLNATLRRDREPLDGSQVQIAASSAALAALDYGPYRPGLDELSNPMIPIDSVPVRNLVQSDCWWSGRAAGSALTSDPVRLHWEGVIDLAGGARSLWKDDEDGLLDIGACRINDPQTRQPVRNAEGRDEHVATDCSRFNGAFGSSAAALALPDPATLPRCAEDVSLFALQLDAYTPLVGEHNACTGELAGDPAKPGQPLRDRRIASLGPGGNTDAFSGVLMPVEQGGRIDYFVDGCSKAEGYSVAPIQHTRYRVEVLGSPHWIGPAVLLADHGMKLRRPLTRRGNGAPVQWQTEILGPVAGQVRWRENFASRVRVGRVRVLDVAQARDRDFQPAQPPLLCVVDAESGSSACRWYCKDSDPRDGRLEYDLLDAHACFLDPSDPVNTADQPQLTPTYAPGTVQNAAFGSIDEPLRWQLELPPGLAAEPMIEFTLSIPGEGAALMAEKPALDFGSLAPGTSLRGGLRVSNVGGSQARVIAVRIEPGAQSIDYRAEVPHAGSPVPLPLLVDLSAPAKVRTVALPELESQRLFAVTRRSAHVRYGPTLGGQSMVHAGVGLELRDGLWFRPSSAQPFVFRAPAPGVMAPFARVSYVPRSLPFLVAPGEGFEVSIITRPTAPGRRDARALIDFEDIRQPGVVRTIAVSLTANALLGPVPQAAPGNVNIAAARSGWTAPRSVLLVNNGDQAFELRSAQITGVGGAVLNLPFRIEAPEGVPATVSSGGSTLLRVQYLAACDAFSGGGAGRSAELRLLTRSGGRSQWVLVPLRGVSSWCP